MKFRVSFDDVTSSFSPSHNYLSYRAMDINWNVRLMIDTEGPMEVASWGSEWGEERKVDLVVSELAR